MQHTFPSFGQLSIHLLGKFCIEYEEQPIHLPLRKTESVLAYLVLHPDAHSREKLAALFWGDSPETYARGSLRKALTLLRKHISSELLLADRETVQLNPSFPLWVDVNAFEAQAQGLLDASTSQLNQFDALCYPGELLVDFYGNWILSLREHYQTLYLDVLLRGVETARAQSEFQTAIEYAQRILLVDQVNERAYQHLMFCYMTLGERTKALEQYVACQRTLQDELGVEPTRETQSLYRWIQQIGMETPSLAARITNLPIPISSFVGRGRELSKIKKLLRDTRLVTLTGPGGGGKTRLAIHAATDLIDSFEDGVWWVELAPVTESSFVPFAVAKALGLEGRSDLPMMETLQKYLCTKKVLIVLDNCEHLIDASAHLAETLLTCCAELKILATSREALHLTGENVRLVPPLSLPEMDTITLLDLLMEYEGVRLFIERARAINPEFKPDDENAVAVTQVCQRLDGIPLAIELAAARVRSMTVEQISTGLDSAFQLLTSSNRTTNLRHQTLRATVDWSYELLSEPERLLFCRLSIFSGGWMPVAAEAVCSGDGLERDEIPDLLTQLADKSLVNLSGDGQRYSMLETMRQYGDEKLIGEDEENQIFERYLDYYIKTAEIADEKIRGPEQRTWLKWFEMEQDNLTNAMEGAFGSSGMLEKGCELLCHQGWYLGGVAGKYIHLKRWVEIALPRSAELGRTPIRAKVLFTAGSLSVWGLIFLDVKDAKSAIEESLAIWQELPQDHLLEEAQCLLALGWIQKYQLSEDIGVENLKKSIEIFKNLGNLWWHAWALNLFGEVQDRDDNYFQVRENILKEEASLLQQAGDLMGSALPLMDMGSMLLAQGKLLDAQKYLSESLKIYRGFGANKWIFQLLVKLGNTTRELKEYDQAETHYKESIQYVQMLMYEDDLTWIYLGLGYIALAKTDMGQARDNFNKALKISQEIAILREYRTLFSIAGLACFAVVQKEFIYAARLFGAFYKNLELLEFNWAYKAYKLATSIDRQEIARHLAECKNQLGEKSFNTAWAEGSALSIDEMLDEVASLSD